MRKMFGWVLLSCLAVLLAGCGKGLDRKLSTADSQAFVNSVQAATEEMNGDQQVAFAWALSNTNDHELESRYKNSTPRKIINGVADSQIEKITKELNRLEANKAAFDKIRNAILKVQVSKPTYESTKDFFGDKANIHATVMNSSDLAFSSLMWAAELYINGSEKSVAQAKLYDLYTIRDEGLKPGEQRERVFAISDSGFDNRGWHTLEVKQAKSHLIKISLLPEEAQDLGERNYLIDSPYLHIAQLQKELEAAKNIRSVITN